jgi:hypothetical protein
MADEVIIQESPQGYQREYMPQTLLDKNPNVILELLKPTSVLEDVIHFLKKELKMKNEDGEDVWVTPLDEQGKTISPFLNENGISMVRYTFFSVVNTNTTLSDLSEEQIEKIMIGFHKRLADLFFMKWREFAMEKDTIAYVTESTCDMVWETLMWAHNKNTKEWLKSTHHTQENISRNPNEQSGGIFSFFGSRKA